MKKTRFLSFLSGLAFCANLVVSPFYLNAQSSEAQPELKDADCFMFIGMDLKLKHGEDYLTVAGLAQRSFLLKSNDGFEQVKTGMTNDFQYERHSKVSPHFAFIEDIKVKEEYTARSDPNAYAARTQTMLNDQALRAQDEATRAMLDKQAAEGALIAAESGTGQGASNALKYADEYLAKATHTAMRMEISGVSDATNLANDSRFRDPKNFPRDAVDISFSINANHTIRDPYVVLLVKVKDQFNPSEEPVTWINFRNLPDLGPEVKRIRYLDASFPDGFLVEDYQVFVFGNGGEIATNLSKKRVGLDRDQALTFLHFQYQQEHTGETLDPFPILAFFPYDEVLNMNAELARSPMRFKVSANGGVTGIDFPKNLHKLLSVSAQRALFGMSFYPALENGQPVDGDVLMSLADMVLQINSTES